METTWLRVSDLSIEVRADEKAYLLKTEVPNKVGSDERRHETTRSSINVDRAIDVPLDEQVIDLLGIFVLSSESCAENGADTNSVLVNQVDSLFRVDHISLGSAVDVLLLDVKVASGLLPAHLHGRVHDYVGTAEVLAFGFPLVDPALLHGKSGKHDGFGGADCGGAHGVGVLIVGRNVEEASNHADAAVLDIGAHGVLFVVDEVLAEGVDHELLDLGLHVGGDERSEAVACYKWLFFLEDCDSYLRVGLPSRVRSSLIKR
jgi:hypothetical protein